jgi:hypothetical protein
VMEGEMGLSPYSDKFFCASGRDFIFPSKKKTVLERK